MKRLISLFLSAVILLSCIPVSFATDGTSQSTDDTPPIVNDYSIGTEVEFVGTGTESYQVTVPAQLNPGSQGTVTVSGTWAANRAVSVTADTSVTLVNSIDSNYQKELDITFEGIYLVGSNTVAVEESKPISVSNISNAIFGQWTGKFYYNVSIEDYSSNPIYFMQPYSADMFGQLATFVFMDGGGGVILLDGVVVQELDAGTLSFGPNSITINDQNALSGTIEVVNKTTVIWHPDETMEFTFVLEDDDIVYGEDYIATVEGIEYVITINSDKSGQLSVGGTVIESMPANSVTEDKSLFLVGGEQMGLILNDGKWLFVEGLVFKLPVSLKELTDHDADGFSYDLRDKDGYLSTPVLQFQSLRVSAATPSVDDLDGGMWNIVADGEKTSGTLSSSNIMLNTDGSFAFVADAMFIVVYTAGAQWEMDGSVVATFPETGIYVITGILSQELGTGNIQIDAYWGELSEAPTGLELVSATYDSITVTPIEGCEYSINGTVWQDSNVISGLKHSAQYTVYARFKDSGSGIPSASCSISASTVSIDTPTPELVEMNKISLVSVNGYEYSIDGSTWQDSGVFDGLTSGKTYTLYMRKKQTDNLPASPATSTKITTVPMPEQPNITEITYNSIKVEYSSGVEYSVDGVTWTSNTSLGSLEHSTTYTLYVRTRASGVYAASNHITTSFTTLAPKLITYDTIELTPRDGYEYSINSSDEWTTTPTYTGLSSGTTYSIKERVVGETYYRYYYTFTTLSNPKALETQSVTDVSITIKPVDNLEYSIDGGANWQDSNVFAGLHPGITYTISARYKAYDKIPASAIVTKNVMTTQLDGVYYVGVTSDKLGNFTGCTAHYTNEDDFPSPSPGDVYIYGDYEYRYELGYYNFSASSNGWRSSPLGHNEDVTFTDGWGVRVRKYKSSYDQMLSEVNGEPVKYMYYTFARTSLVDASTITIPNTVVLMDDAYFRCYDLVTAPYIPSNVKYMARTFSDCTSLLGEMTVDADFEEKSDIWDCFNGAVDVGNRLYLYGTSPDLYMLEESDGGWSDMSEYDRVRVANSKIFIDDVAYDTGDTAMTWAEWCDSPYNPGCFFIDNVNHLGYRYDESSNNYSGVSPYDFKNDIWWGLTGDYSVTQGAKLYSGYYIYNIYGKE